MFEGVKNPPQSKSLDDRGAARKYRELIGETEGRPPEQRLWPENGRKQQEERALLQQQAEEMTAAGFHDRAAALRHARPWRSWTGPG